MQQDWLQEVGAICLLGVPGNAALICELFNRNAALEGALTVRLGNPAWLAGTASSQPAGTCFARMQGQEAPASLGGWHRLTGSDYLTYALLGILQSKRAFDRFAASLLEAHPAWPALSFLDLGGRDRDCPNAGLDRVAAARLLTTILDPRWHVDPHHENRSARLKGFLGLGDPEGIPNLRSVLLAEPRQARRGVAQAKLVLDVWTGGNHVPPPLDVLGPGGFLWRVQARRDGRRNTEAGTRGMLRACHVFLRFLRDVWLDNLTEATGYVTITEKLGKKAKAGMTRRVKRLATTAYAPELFVPEHFFETSVESAAWRDHLLRLRRP